MCVKSLSTSSASLHSPLSPLYLWKSTGYLMRSFPQPGFCFLAIVIGSVQINSQKSSIGLGVSYMYTTKDLCWHCPALHLLKETVMRKRRDWTAYVSPTSFMWVLSWIRDLNINLRSTWSSQECNRKTPTSTAKSLLQGKTVHLEVRLFSHLRHRQGINNCCITRALVEFGGNKLGQMWWRALPSPRDGFHSHCSVRNGSLDLPSIQPTSTRKP